MNDRLQVFAVLRWDTYEDRIRVTVKEILPTAADAQAEVQRLNQLNGPKGANYFWQATRYYPKGRDEESKSDSDAPESIAAADK